MKEGYFIMESLPGVGTIRAGTFNEREDRDAAFQKYFAKTKRMGFIQDKLED